MSVVVLVGNPRPRSRTHGAAHLVTEALTGHPAGLTVELAVSVLFDRRFEHIAARAAPTEYRGQI